eukprot:gene26185-31619_t
MFTQEDSLDMPHPHPIPSFSPARKKNRSNQHVEPASHSFSQGIALNFSQSSWIASGASGNDGETNSNSSKPSQGDTIDFSQASRPHDIHSYYTTSNHDVISQSMPFALGNNSNFLFSQENSGPNSNAMSQFSTLSQDFAERLGHLHVRCSQDNNNSMVAPPNEDSSFIAPQPRSAKPPVGASNKSLSTIEEKQIELQPPIANPFLSSHSHYNEWYFSRPYLHTSIAYPSKIWISAFKERPRYITDFQEIACIGEGNFSQVFAVRHRLDGSLYAIKKNKVGIQTENHLRYLLRETNALAALRGQRGIIGYYGVWVEEGVLYIQMELCAGGSVEDLVSATPTQGSLMYVERLKRGLGSVGKGSGVRIERNRSDSYISDSGGTETGEFLTQPTSMPSSPISTGHKSMGINEELAWALLREVGEGLACMHAKGLVHLDIRPANVFICAGEGGLVGEMAWWDDQFGEEEQGGNKAAAKGNSLFSAVMGGGGMMSLNTPRGPSATPLFALPPASSPLPPLATARASYEQHIISGRLKIKIGDFGHVRGIKEAGAVIEGDSRYCARELINSDCHSLDLTKADIFSLGASVYELCLGRGLGKGGDEAMAEWHSIRDGNLDSQFLGRYSPSLVSLIQAMLHHEPARRPSAIEVVAKAMAVGNEGSSLGKAGDDSNMSAVDEVGEKDLYVRQLKEENERLKNLLSKLGQR